MKSVARIFAWLVAVVLAGFLALPDAGQAHRSGCHRWHSCPSDRGTYTCGDTGHCNYCPDNQYCQAGRPRAVSAPQEQDAKPASPQALAPSLLLGRVVQVTDGDDVTVRDARKVQQRVRLQGIDAPEYDQPYGDVSRENLARLVSGKTVEVLWTKRDSYDRLVGTVFLEGRDINLEQVKAGLAWHYKYYAGEQRPDDRQRYTKAENDARIRKLGLWHDAHPVPPWEHRRRK